MYTITQETYLQAQLVCELPMYLTYSWQKYLKDFIQLWSWAKHI